MGENLLQNPGFEMDWSIDKSHRCIIFPVDDEPYEADIGNIFTPSGGWTTWFRHDPGTWDQPEVRDAWKNIDPHRVRSGEKGILLFTFCRKHDAGFFQQVQVKPGTELRLTAWVHAWSNHLGTEHGGHPHDGRWSDGSLVGYGVIALEMGQIPELNGDPQNDANGNVGFVIGINPAGGTDPFADTVEWGKEYFVYNGYCQQLEAEAVATASTVTVFLRSTTLWEFTHNDTYWDDIKLEGNVPPTPERGQPREQYERTYVLMPPDVTLQEVHDAVDRHFVTRRTIGFSADDAGIGDLDERRVMAVRPDAWADSLSAFFETYYPSVKYAMDREEPPEPPLPPGPRVTQGHIGLHLQTMTVGWEEFVRDLRPPMCKVLASMHDVVGVKRTCCDTTAVFRHVTNAYHDTLENPDPMAGARCWIDKFRDSLYEIVAQLDHELPGLEPPYFYVESLNECYPSLNTEHVLRAANFDMAFIDALSETGLPIAPAVFCAAVGNPHESEYELLVPLARKCEQAEGLMGYHPYWLANPDYGDPDHLWKYLAGRWTEMDKVFVQHGIRVRWYGGEGGVVGGASGENWVSLLPIDGWKSPECCNGDWNRYLNDIVRFDELVREWNLEHDDRFLGSVLFTSGASYTGWQSFWITEPEMRGIRTALEERYE